MEVVLYEFSFDYAKAIGFFIVLLIGAAFFFADKLVGRRAEPYVDIGSRTKEISPKVDFPVVASITRRRLSILKKLLNISKRSIWITQLPLHTERSARLTILWEITKRRYNICPMH